VKRNLAVLAIVVMILAALVEYPDAASTAQQKKPTAKEKMATIDYLVGSWSCAHTVGGFSGKYTTKVYEGARRALAEANVRLPAASVWR
jgi:polyisoprenoid-binding protein YceI